MNISAGVAYRRQWLGVPDGPNTLFPDFSMGVYYYHSDKLYAGLSVPQIFGLFTVFRDSTDGRAFDIQRVQHLYGVVGSYVAVDWFGSSTSILEPSLWLRYAPNSPPSANANVRYQISEFFYLGVGASVGLGSAVSSAIHLEAGMKLGESVNILSGQ